MPPPSELAVAVTTKFCRAPVVWRFCGFTVKTLVMVNTSPTFSSPVMLAVQPFVMSVEPVWLAPFTTGVPA